MPATASSSPALAPTDATRTSSRAPSTRRQETQDSEKAGRVWAREAEEDPWAPCILTLDGGGIRGYSSLMILKALMHEVWLWECRLDEEDAAQVSGARRASSGVRGSPSSSTDAQGGAERARSGKIAAGSESGEGDGDGRRSRGRSPLANEVYSEPLSTIPDRNAASPSGEPSQEPTATLQQDNLTAKPSVKTARLEEELLPCHYFDFMYGTSTGGLIATILGRLRMTVSEGLTLYAKVGDDLFGKRRSNIPLTTKYHHQPLEKAVRELVGARFSSDGEDPHPWDAGTMAEPLELLPFDVDAPRVCQSCCLTATQNDDNVITAHLLRSYPHFYGPDTPNFVTLYNEGADLLPIWQVTRATSAAPFYFDMLRADVSGVAMAFKDGGIRENNPSSAALSEFRALYAGRVDRPALMLSVGTGIPDQGAAGFATSWSGFFGKWTGLNKFMEKRAVVQNLLIKYTEGEKQHRDMRMYAEGEHTWYKRLNVDVGLGSMPLDEWVGGEWHGEKGVKGGETLTKMEAVTARYLERGFDEKVDSYAPPRRMVQQAAEKLVRQRRARERLGGERWEAFVGRNLHRRRRGGEDGAAG